jgi:hypothetical protein
MARVVAKAALLLVQVRSIHTTATSHPKIREHFIRLETAEK